jgi:hypothetical protein
MPTLTVTKHGQTKKGSPVVYFNNKHTFQDMVFLGRETQAPPIGALIDAELGSKPRDDGGTMWFLNAWGLAPNQMPVAPTSPPVATNEALKPIAAPEPYTEPERMFISNIVAAAITGGHATDPIDLIAWTRAALKALRSCTE